MQPFLNTIKNNISTKRLHIMDYENNKYSLGDPNYEFSYIIGGKKFDAVMFKRPNVDNFLKYFTKSYNIVHFTAESYEYINAAIKHFDINVLEDCDGPSNDFRKDLIKVTSNLKKVVMIDDSCAEIFIESFQGNQQDDWLFPKKFIWEFLNIHSKSENFRLEIMNSNTAAILRIHAEERFRQMRAVKLKIIKIKKQSLLEGQQQPHFHLKTFKCIKQQQPHRFKAFKQMMQEEFSEEELRARYIDEVEFDNNIYTRKILTIF
ncbi:hypothetical protein B4U79_18063 [Dinothrombium tinctorium]|uniref:FCP1 homology domain-containing protein n=1 Tax=Dinothrombium tinctorium TaxID=1965070 RepID=A0A3S3PJB2_9ACAR|nr:hypothetical protein B4U79_18063 [Dinothrombium tinctorium]